MGKINLIMPMGGHGVRFATQGELLPKPMLKINDKPFFYWATESIYRFVPIEQLVFVVLKEHIDNYKIDAAIKQYYPCAEIEVLDEVLNGAVLTCMNGSKRISNTFPVLFNDCDHVFYAPALYEYCKKNKTYSLDGLLLTFQSSDPKFSFLEYGADGYVKRTVEKQVISNDAICGAYWFRNTEIFLKAAEKYLTACDYTEYFMSGVYNVMCDGGLRVKGTQVDMHLPFGTPEEYSAAMESDLFETFNEWR